MNTNDNKSIKIGNHNDDGIDLYTALLITTIRIGFVVAVSYGSYKFVKSMVGLIDNKTVSESEMKQVSSVLAKKLNRDESSLNHLEFNRYEISILNDICGDDTSNVKFSDIGGLESQIQKIKENIIVPLKLWRVLNSKGKGISHPSGMLLYGKPGTGKTYCVRALANETDATLIAIKASTLLDKYFGESQKLVTALFSVARKLAPSIIFIDEIDTLLRKRGSNSGAEGHGGMDGVQGAFLAEWDGLHNTAGTGAHVAPIVVIGATNKPNDLDKAILRRMPISIQMPIPDSAARKDILLKNLKGETLSNGINIDKIVEEIEGFTGSDIREFVRVVLLERNKELIDVVMAEGFECDKMTNSSSGSEPNEDETVTPNQSHYSAMVDAIINRPLKQSDFDNALSSSKPTGEAAVDYESELLTENYEERLRIAKDVKRNIESNALGLGDLD